MLDLRSSTDLLWARKPWENATVLAVIVSEKDPLDGTGRHLRQRCGETAFSDVPCRGDDDTLLRVLRRRSNDSINVQELVGAIHRGFASIVGLERISMHSLMF